MEHRVVRTLAAKAWIRVRTSRGDLGAARKRQISEQGSRKTSKGGGRSSALCEPPYSMSKAHSPELK